MPAVTSVRPDSSQSNCHNGNVLVMTRSRRLTARLATIFLVVTILFGGVPTVQADEVADQQQVIEQLAAELAALNDRIAMIDEEHGGALDQQAVLAAQMVETSAKVDEEQAKLEVLQAEMTRIAVNRFVGGDSLALSPLFSSASSYNDAQQLTALSDLALDTGAGTADELDALLRTLDAHVEELKEQQRQADELVEHLESQQAEGEALIAEYLQKAAEAEARYGLLVQREAERQATLVAEQQARAAREAQDEQARAAQAVPAPATTTVAAPRGGGAAAGAGGADVHSGPVADDRDNAPMNTDPASSEPTAPEPAAPEPVAPEPAIPPPPAVSSRADVAVAAAYSQLGVPYGAFKAIPGVAFDCSGLTMWAWAQAGVSLPHQSKQQYASNPHVPRDEVAPGDLLFFYSPIHHVGMYVGDGMMIDAPHTGAFVRLKAVNWNTVVGISRPG